MADELESGPPKPHRKRQSGPKAEKKKAKKHSPDDASIERNPKAFAFKSAVRAARQFRRKQDVETKRHHEPLVDRTPLQPAPYIIAVVGPPKVGKTTLISSLLKNFTRQQLSDVKGPVTIVSGKKRRLTFLECNNDINSMIDVAKIADLVLLLIDASFGFEMEIFEFLNICQVHGFPKIMGVLTHLDLMKNNKALKKTKKKLKNRFWTEVYQGAKLFYLSGLVYGSYPKVEVHNLGRFISVTKFRPLSWRTTHPYMLADRMEELTDPEMIRKNPKCDRKVSLYGYVRGTHLKQNSRVHIIGCGDHKLEDISLLPDPCPLPNAEKKRSLNEKERLIYAPLSGVGGVVYDKDAVYIDLGGSQAAKEISDPSQVVVRPGNELVTSLIDTKHTIDSKMSTSHLTLFKDGIIISPDKVMENQDTTQPSEKTAIKNDSLVRRKAVFYDSSGSEGQDDDVDGNDSDGESDDDDDDVDDDADDDDAGDDVDDDADDDDAGDDADDDDDDDAGDDADDDDDDDDIDDDDDGEEEEDIREKNEDRYEEITFNFKNCNSQLEKGVKRQLVKSSHNAEVDKARNERNLTESHSGDDDEGEESQDGIKVEGNEIRNGNGNGSLESESDSESEAGFSKVKRRKSDHCSEGVACGETVDKSCKKRKGDKQRAKKECYVNKDVSLSTEKTGKPKMKNRIKETLSETNIDPSIRRECRKLNRKGKCFNEKNLQPDGEDSTGNIEDIEKNKSRETSQAHTDREEEGTLRWKENLAQKAAEAFLRRQQQTPNLRKLVYGNVIHDAKQQTAEESVEDEPLAGLFVVKSRKSSVLSITIDEKDCSLELVHRPLRDWSQPEMLQSIRDCFVTGKWKDSEDAEKLLQMDDQMSDESIFGDFEDLETGEVHRAADNEDAGEQEETDDDQGSACDVMEKKKKKKAAFDAVYDEGDDTNYYEELKTQMTEQAQLNQSAFQDLDDETRAQYEGFRPGLYVRVELSAMPCEFVTHFDARYPVILGGLLSSEDTMGFLQVRFKKHRWHKRILKTRDPVIMSVGWRRFQTLPMYSIQDHNGRHRLLKYTPEHLHCMATLFGPITPPGTGTLAIQATASNMADFRISATGIILDLDKSVQLVKKLKLTGTPMKIFKNTAFIKGMFNSALEVAKFEGATIRTVSGIRGQVKRALKIRHMKSATYEPSLTGTHYFLSPNQPSGGTFRATFEDKILISDIVFMRTWYPVTVPNFYNPVTSLLLAPDQKEKWQGMRTVSQLRRDLGLKPPVNHDSLYKPVERETRRFNPLVIPAKLQRELPFKSKPKLMKKRTKPSLESKRAVVMEPHEKSAYTLMQQLYTVNKEKQRKRKEKLEQRRKEHRAEEEKKTLKRQQRQREERKKIFRMMGQAEKRRKKT